MLKPDETIYFFIIVILAHITNLIRLGVRTINHVYKVHIMITYFSNHITLCMLHNNSTYR